MSEEVKNLSRENIEENGFWSEGSFVESINPNELREKIKTLEEDACKDVKFKCKKCNKQISAHNKNWHDEMCDDCFNAAYFPYDEKKIVEESLR